MVSHIVMFSGGVGSWMAARRVRDAVGAGSMVLLFADTLIEDDDLYRFIDEAAEDIGVPLIRIADGRTPQQVFEDRGFIGNTRVSLCSYTLKQRPCRRWIEQNATHDATVYVGIDWTEAHRMAAIERNWQPWRAVAPLCERPYVDRDEVFAKLAAAGIKPPRLYAMGFAHNNCGGSCVRGGQAQWKRLLSVFPERFESWERHEDRMRDRLGDISILRDRRGGVTRPLPLRVLRRRVECGQQIDESDIGGCGCFVEAGQ